MTAASAALAVGDWTIVGFILPVLVGLAMLFLLVDDLVLGFGALFLVTVAGIMAGTLQTPLFGGTARGVRVAAVADHPAAIYHFTDGHVLRDASDWVSIWGGSKGTHHVLYELRIAPIVGEDWRPDQPVTAWAVTSAPSAGLPRQDWSRPSRAGVRAVRDQDELRAAIPRIERRHGLHSAPGAPLLHWLDDPEAVVAGERRRLATITLVAIGFWVALVLGRRLTRMPPKRAGAGRGR